MFGQGREIYRRGDTLEIDPVVLEKHPKTLEKVESESSSEADTEEDEGSAAVEDLDPHPSDLKVDELEERIEDVDDVALLDAILTAETQSKDRTTAVNVIESRISELEE